MPNQPFLSTIKENLANADFTVGEPLESDFVNDLFGSDPDEIENVTQPKNTQIKEPVKGQVKQETLAPPERKNLTSDDVFGDDEEEEELTEKPVEEELIDETKTPVKEEIKEPEESTYQLLSKDLINLGIFTPNEDEEGNEIALDIKTPEDFRNQFQLEVRKQTGDYLEKFLEQHGPEYGEMFQAVFVDGVPPTEYITRQAKIDNYSNFSIETEEAQEKIVRQLYRTEGRSQESIDKRIEKLKSYGDLEDEAKEAKDALVQKEQATLQNLAQQKQQEAQNKARIRVEYQTNVQRILAEKLKDRDFDGIPLEKETAKRTLDYLTKDAYKTPQGTMLTEFDKEILDLNRPENHILKVKVGLLMQLIKTDPTLSKLGNKKSKDKVNSLFSELERKSGKKQQPQQTNNRQVNTKLSSYDF